ncbi:MAG TPA: 2Fe-2S iron-sulfur cluster-binding protein [Prochlorococcaceae cyanobacterium AMR_MDS_5431]|nr:2Fe-2S iron-sulfur cluster-binding protein [Prochlorococcaceae cyanobacterium AMR_MDS_5431]
MEQNFNVTISLNGRTQTFSCSSDQTILSGAESAGIELPSSCCAGLCTTCAARLSEGKIDQPDAMGIKPELQDEGYVLLCVAYPRSDLSIEAGQEDALYEAQFGQYQK